MEYTKDMILGINYGQAKKKRRIQFLEKIEKNVRKHKFITTIISITCTLVLIDFILIFSFVNILISI